MKKVVPFLIIICFVFFFVTSCSKDSKYLHQALKLAGDNKGQLEYVLNHYRKEDHNPEKLKAAKFLISNMPDHYSYADMALVNDYYRVALSILGTGPNPDWQRDTLSEISERDFGYLLHSQNYVSDVTIMDADYLINNIDQAYTLWKTKPWAKQLTFDDFLEWLLPYKAIDLQTLDNWRDVLSTHYNDSIKTVPIDDVLRTSIWGAIEIVRQEIHKKQSDIGLRVIWDAPAIIPLRSADTWIRMTFGNCVEYVSMGVSVYRSLGLPAMIDGVPIWGRNRAGHCWYVFPSDRGVETQSQEEMIEPAGPPFYPYERLPKVYRSTYAVNRAIAKYNKSTKFPYYFPTCRQDVTDHYCRTSDLEIELLPGVKPKDKYLYIAMFGVVSENQWEILDFGEYRRGKAHFKKMGRDIQYIVLGYNGNHIVPMSHPFILEKNGSIRYIICDEKITHTVKLKRKYYQAFHVVDMRRRILGGKIQCSNDPSFRNCKTIYTIETTDIPDKLQLQESGKYRYWRYFSPEKSYGSIAELAFFDEKGEKISGRGIANSEAGQDAIKQAFDDDWLTNFEVNKPNGNWIGVDLGNARTVYSVRIVPRSDDNDIHPGQEYELCYLDNKSHWRSLGKKVAVDNYLQYDYVPTGALLWLINHTTGLDERPFIYYDYDNIEWR